MGDSRRHVDFRRNDKYPVTKPVGGYFDGGRLYHSDPHPIWSGRCAGRLLGKHPGCPHIGDFPKVWT